MTEHWTTTYAKWGIENADLYNTIVILIQFMSFPIGLLLFNPIVWAFFMPLIVGVVSEAFLWWTIKKSGLLIVKDLDGELSRRVAETECDLKHIAKNDVEKT
jgi:hypothetical protein